MKFKLSFQYKGPDDERPGDEEQELPIELESALLVPNVGDSILISGDTSTVTGKVLTRHFAYFKGWCVVNIVYTDISDEELGTRLKE